MTIRKTAEGIELTHKTVRGLVGLLALLVAAVAFTLRTSDRVTGAVQRPEFIDTTKAIRRSVHDVTTSLEKTAKQSFSVQCYLAKYPVGLCDDVPRTLQAGQQRRDR
jgi:hypothetical protein